LLVSAAASAAALDRSERKLLTAAFICLHHALVSIAEGRLRILTLAVSFCFSYQFLATESPCCNAMEERNRRGCSVCDFFDVNYKQQTQLERAGGLPRPHDNR
jgi:hypothetical protein